MTTLNGGVCKSLRTTRVPRKALNSSQSSTKHRRNLGCKLENIAWPLNTNFVFVDEDKDEKVTKATFSFGRATATTH
jgi:hypothetical protein